MASETANGEFDRLRLYWQWCSITTLVWVVVDLNPNMRELPLALAIINCVIPILVAPALLDYQSRKALAKRDYKLSNQLIGPAVVIGEIMNIIPGNPYAIGLPFFLMMRAVNLEKLEKSAEAEKVLRRLISLHETSSDKNVMREARAKTLLSNALSAQGKYEESEAASREAVATYEKIADVQPWTVAASLADLCTTLSNKGKAKQALEVGTKALRIMESAASDNDRSRLILLGMTLNNLAVAYEHAGNPKEAHALYERSLKMKLKLFGPESKEAVIGYNNLGCALINQDRYEEAKDAVEQAKELAIRLELTEGRLWPNIISNSGDVHRALGNLEEAERELLESLRLREEKMPHELHDSYENLGKLYRDKKDFILSERYFRQGMEQIEKRFGVDHPKVARIARDYAKLLHTMNREIEAGQLDERANLIELNVVK